MRIGVFDSGLGGLTIVRAIAHVVKGADIFYIADTQFAPYGEKTPEQILHHSVEITQYLIRVHEIDVLVVACNTATSAAIQYLRETFKELIVIGTEPGIKPAIESTLTNKVGVLATPATLQGDKYQVLLNELAVYKSVELFEQACPGLVEEIEKGEIEGFNTTVMLENWLKPMLNNGVDTIVLGCTHYPLIAPVIKKIMGSNIKLIETGSAIATRLLSLGEQRGHINEGALNVSIYFTGEINLKMVDQIINQYEHGGKIMVRDINEQQERE